MEYVKIANTPYDDVFRTLLNDCSSLIIPMINELFGEHYAGKEKIIQFCQERSKSNYEWKSSGI